MKKLYQHHLFIFLLAIYLPGCGNVLENPDYFYEAGKELFDEEQYVESKEYFSKAARIGHAPSQTILGLMYLEGKGVEIDLQKAHYWFKKASDQNYAAAQNNLGLLYLRGDGVEKNYEIAKKLFEDASSKSKYAKLNLILLKSCERQLKLQENIDYLSHEAKNAIINKDYELAGELYGRILSVIDKGHPQYNYFKKAKLKIDVLIDRKAIETDKSN